MTGQLTVREIALELYHANHFPYIPDDEETFKKIGITVFNEDTFDTSIAVPGDLVTEEVVDFFINCLPPACMRSDCSQLGEAYSHKEDPTAGKWRATFLTFKLSHDDILEYCGHCFAGENIER